MRAGDDDGLVESCVLVFVEEEDFLTESLVLVGAREEDGAMARFEMFGTGEDAGAEETRRVLVLETLLELEVLLDDDLGAECKELDVVLDVETKFVLGVDRDGELEILLELETLLDDEGRIPDEEREVIFEVRIGLVGDIRRREGEFDKLFEAVELSFGDAAGELEGLLASAVLLL